MNDIVGIILIIMVGLLYFSKETRINIFKRVIEFTIFFVLLTILVIGYLSLLKFVMSSIIAVGLCFCIAFVLTIVLAYKCKKYHE